MLGGHSNYTASTLLSADSKMVSFSNMAAHNVFQYGGSEAYGVDHTAYCIDLHTDV